MRIMAATKEELLPECLYSIGAGFTTKPGNRKYIPYVLKRINFVDTKNINQVKTLLKLENNEEGFINEDTKIGSHILITFAKRYIDRDGITQSGIYWYNHSLNTSIYARAEAALYRIEGVNVENEQLKDIVKKANNTRKMRKQKLKENKIIKDVYGNTTVYINKQWLYDQIKTELSGLGIKWNQVRDVYLK